MSILTLALAYVFLLALLLLALLRSELAVSLKIALVVFCALFYIWHYNGLQAFRGWPAEQRLPPRFELVARVVVEPSRKQDEAGGIYLWLRDLDRTGLVPRSYRLPYSRETHRAVDDTIRRQQQGQRFVGRPAAQSGAGARSAVAFEAVQRERDNRKPGSD